MLVDPPENGTVVMNTNGTAEYEPDPGFAGTDTFTYTVRDQFNAVSNVATVTVTVVTDAPPWQNPTNSLDVNGDGVIAPNDVLAVINEINIRGAQAACSAPVGYRTV